MVARPGAVASADELIEDRRGRPASFQVPRTVELVGAFSPTTTGKIDRRPMTSTAAPILD
jgi:hypothetical protein